MTDTVNVPRAWLRDAFLVLANDDGPLAKKFYEDLQSWVAAAPKAEPVSGDWYSAESIDALVREIDVALNGDNAAPQAKLCDLVKQIKELATPEAPKVEQKPYGYVEKHDFHALMRGQYTSISIYRTKSPIAGYGPSVPLYADPAPASDELLEDLCFLLQSHEETEGDGVSLETRLSDLIAKHKGPQS